MTSLMDKLISYASFAGNVSRDVANTALHAVLLRRCVIFPPIGRRLCAKQDVMTRTCKRGERVGQLVELTSCTKRLTCWQTFESYCAATRALTLCTHDEIVTTPLHSFYKLTRGSPLGHGAPIQCCLSNDIQMTFERYLGFCPFNIIEA